MGVEMKALCLRVSFAALGSTLCASQAMSQVPVGRGAPDPVEATVVVGSEGKGMHTGEGVPPGNPPIVAARDGAIPAGVTPLAGRYLQHEGFLQGSSVLVRSTLLPLQFPDGP